MSNRPFARLGSFHATHPKEAFTVVALTAGGTLAFYAYMTFLQKFLVGALAFILFLPTQYAFDLQLLERFVEAD